MQTHRFWRKQGNISSNPDSFTVTYLSRKPWYPPFTAPEAHLQPTKAMSHDALKTADIWAFGLIMYCLINPDIDNPYAPAFIEAGVAENLDSLKYMFQQKRLPIQQPKYEFLQLSEWWQIEEAFNACAKFDPESRPSATELLSVLSLNEPECSLNFMHLAVSQASALDVADHGVAERLNDNPINGLHPAVFSPGCNERVCFPRLGNMQWFTREQ